MLVALLFILLVVWLIIRSGAGGTPEQKIERAAKERGWEVVQITNQSSFIFKTSKYRVLYTTADDPQWQEAFCNPSVFGIIWFDSTKISNFWLSRLP